ncbi:MAG: 2-C-methyl-D-erythritol 4-phosphate cytidylyltransferase [Thermodesulfobacteriota bacterium]
MQTWCILLAAGQGSRMGSHSTKKQFLDWQNKPLYWHSVRAFSAMPCIQGLVFVFPSQEMQNRSQELQDLFQLEQPGVPYLVIPGGQTRQESSWAGIQALPRECELVLIHDAARPFVPPDLVQEVIQALHQGAKAVVPGLRPTDTIKQQGSSTSTLPRQNLYAVQTPQGFNKQVLQESYQEALSSGLEFTDDAAVLEHSGHRIQFVPGRAENRKLTNPQDLELLQSPQEMLLRSVCSSFGYDVHKYGPGRPLRLGGVPITNAPEVQAHSDGDVLLHAIMDALLGCLGQGDIGELFPDSDPALDGANSAVLLSEVLSLAQKQNLKILHLDLTIVCQTPRLTPWKDHIKKNLCNLLYLQGHQLGLKASTEEGLGFTGEKKGIKAMALLTAQRQPLAQDPCAEACGVRDL